MGMDAEASKQRTPEDLLGSVLGTCKLERILGRGGMGVVYLAQQSRPHRQVAVKVLLLSLLPDPDRRARFLKRFRREADAVAALDHPNILPIYEYGEQADLAYLVMPYVSGGTLRNRVERKGQLPLTEVAGFLAQMAAALDYAHARGVIHRDVKPQNMLLYPDKRLMLSDFGIAKVAAQAAADEHGQLAPQLTTQGHVVGTPDYIAPEQAIGQPVDARADIYSLGVVLFYLVTGRVPFIAPQPMTVAALHVAELPPKPRQFRPDLPPAAEAVILKALAKEPAGRYRTAGDFSRAFRAALPTLPAPAPSVERHAATPKATVPPPAVPPRVHPAGRELPPPTPPLAAAESNQETTSTRRRWLAIGATLLLIILAAGGAYAATNIGKHQTSVSGTITASPIRTPPPTSTVRPTPTNTPTPTPTSTPSPPVYTAEQFEPQQSDLPAGTTATAPQTAITADQFHQLYPDGSRVVDPTQGSYHWQKDIFIAVEQGDNAYLEIALDQFNAAADAQQYFQDVAPHIQPDAQQHAIGQQEKNGFCCDSNPTAYNIFFQDQNVTVIIQVVMSTSQAIQDGLSVGMKMDQRAQQPTQTGLADRWLANHQRMLIAAAAL